jgi:hypothetical protein
MVASAAAAIERRLIGDTAATCFGGPGDAIRSVPTPQEMQAIDSWIDTAGENSFVTGAIFPPGIAFAGALDRAAEAFQARVVYRDSTGEVWLEAPDSQGNLRGVQLTEITTPKGRTVWIGNTYMTPISCPSVPVQASPSAATHAPRLAAAGTSGLADPQPTPSSTPINALPDVPIVTIPAAAIRTVAIPEPLVGEPAIAGGFGFVTTREASGPAVHLWAINFATLKAARVAPNLRPGEELASVLTDGRFIAIETYRRYGPRGQQATPCRTDSANPISWRISVAGLGADGLPGTWFVVDAGVSRVVFRPPLAGEYCDGPLLPPLALTGGRLAYATEGVSAKSRTNAAIIGVDLTSRNVNVFQWVANIAVNDPVTSVGISAQTTLGIAVENAHTNSRAEHWQVFAQTPSGHEWSWKGVTRERSSYWSVPVVGAEADAIAYQVRLNTEGTEVGLWGERTAGAEPQPRTAFECDMTSSLTHIVVMSCSKDYQGTNRVVVIWRLNADRVQIPQLERATLGSGWLGWRGLDSAGHATVRSAPLSSFL